MLQKVLEVEDLAVFPTTQGSTIPDFTETNEILLSLCNVRRQKGNKTSSRKERHIFQVVIETRACAHYLFHNALVRIISFRATFHATMAQVVFEEQSVWISVQGDS